MPVYVPSLTIGGARQHTVTAVQSLKGVTHEPTGACQKKIGWVGLSPILYCDQIVGDRLCLEGRSL
jgi:hypothetical protein